MTSYRYCRCHQLKVPARPLSTFVLNGLQSGGGRNALLFTMELCDASILILLVSFATSEGGKKIRERGFFNQWTLLTLVPVLTNSAGGILVGLVIKYAGTIRKGFALNFGILISGILQNVIDEEKSFLEEFWQRCVMVTVIVTIVYM